MMLQKQFIVLPLFCRAGRAHMLQWFCISVSVWQRLQLVNCPKSVRFMRIFFIIQYKTQNAVDTAGINILSRAHFEMMCITMNLVFLNFLCFLLLYFCLVFFLFPTYDDE